MKKIKKTIYQSKDGKDFVSEIECLKYEKDEEEKKAKYTYWCIVHSPDLTEGRGYVHKNFLVVDYDSSYCLDALIGDYCSRTFGRQVQFVQGVQAMVGWIIIKIDYKTFNRDKDSLQYCGDYGQKAEVDYLILGDRETGLVEKEVDKDLNKQ